MLFLPSATSNILRARYPGVNKSEASQGQKTLRRFTNVFLMAAKDDHPIAMLEKPNRCRVTYAPGRSRNGHNAIHNGPFLVQRDPALAGC